MIRAVVFDLDGVVRHHDPAQVDAIEARHGLSTGAITAAAFAEPLITRLVTGRISRADWVREVGSRLGNTGAVAEWAAQIARADPEILRLADELRTAGVTTAILTNGTDETTAEARELGLAAHFDAVYNSAEIGYAKPDVRAFQHVLDGLSVTGPEAFFTDDSASKLAGAVELGMTVHHFTGVDGLRLALNKSGVS